MKKYAVVLAVLAVWFIFTSVVSVFAKDIIWEDIGRGNLALRTVLVNPDNPRVIYAGSSNTVLKSEDGGESWRSILLIRGQNRDVNFLLLDHKNKDFLYAVTGNGLFLSSDQGERWKRIFRGKNYFENECAALAVLPSAIYLGTKAGLFVSKDKGRSWHKGTGKIGSTQILSIAYNPNEQNFIYVASVEGVFISMDSGQSWERTFVASPAENGNDIMEESNEDQDEEGRFSNLSYISIDPNNSNYLYLAASGGVYISQDKGQNWESLCSFGLLNRDVRFLLVSPESHLYAVTKSGIFEYVNNRWQELSLGLVAGDIRFLALDKQNNLYAAGDKGLFKAKIEYSDNKSQGNPISLYYKDEPQIKAVQDAAIKYAEVEPEKIIRWRKQAQKKAILPQVSIGLDRNSSDLWHWETGSTTKSDDDSLRRGKDSLDWDLRLSWDLSELIWNGDQTSIDVRSRLMVELRGDILDQVNKLYFERLRIKSELNNLAIEDRNKRFDKQLKLEELTASLDALTRGYYSEQLRKLAFKEQS